MGPQRKAIRVGFPAKCKDRAASSKLTHGMMIFIEKYGIQEVQVSTRRAGRCDPLALRRHFGPPTTCTRTRTRASCHSHAGAQQGASSPSAGPFGLSSHGMPLCVQRSHGRFSEHFRFLRTQDRQATTTGGFLYFSMGAEGGEVGTNGGVVPGGASAAYA